MHKCEFCHVMFQARPQVKHPRACINCQDKRQQDNERAWHLKNRGLYDKKYHGAKKEVRLKKFRLISEELLQCLKVGKEILNVSIDLIEASGFFFRFLLQLGIRQVNKLWNVKEPATAGTLRA